MRIKRRKTRTIRVGKVLIGGSHPVAIQSMVKVRTADINAVLSQIEAIQSSGCEIVRLAVKDARDSSALKEIKKRSPLPIVADIHFDWRLAMQAIENGVDKIRLNPGNIYKKEQLREIAAAAGDRRIPIRVGVNSGSLRGRVQAGIMVKSALDYVKVLEGFKFRDIVISLKGSDILDTIEAYRKIALLCDYPLHLGVTASGPAYAGLIKSSLAIGALLLEGIGDTIRVSLTDISVQEVRAARGILEALGLRRFGPEIISCPTCGRCEVDLVKIVRDLDSRLSAMSCQLSARPLKVAVMGCVVNGPGEAKEADIGIAFGKKDGLLFKAGKAIKKVAYHDCLKVILAEIERVK